MAGSDTTRWLIPLLATATAAAAVLLHRLLLRNERQTWQRLTVATDALALAAGRDLTQVLHTAVVHTADLVPAADVEIETGPVAGHPAGRNRLVRGNRRGLGYDGAAAQAPPASGRPVAEVPLATTRDERPAGILRLRFHRGTARLTARNSLLVRTLASHAAAAIRNAHNAHEAAHDPLTDLPNRRNLHRSLAEILGKHRPLGQVAVALIDLDNFKEINDTIGHPAGDRALCEVATRLRTAANGALVARLGGDEFALVLIENTVTETVQHAEQVLTAVRGPIPLGGIPASLEASAGLAIATTGIGHDELLRRADVALYRAKGLVQPVRLVVYQPNLDRASTAAGRYHAALRNVRR